MWCFVGFSNLFIVFFYIFFHRQNETNQQTEINSNSNQYCLILSFFFHSSFVRILMIVLGFSKDFVSSVILISHFVWNLVCEITCRGIGSLSAGGWIINGSTTKTTVVDEPAVTSHESLLTVDCWLTERDEHTCVWRWGQGGKSFRACWESLVNFSCFLGTDRRAHRAY